MRAQLLKYSKVVFVLMALALSQCGKKTKSQDVTITTAPTSPIVFLSDYQINIAGTDTTVKAPWFQMLVNIDNEADEDLVILALHVEVTGTDANGAVNTVKTDILPGSNNFTSDTLNCTYTDFGTFAKKSSGTLGVKGTGTCPTFPVMFYLGGNPTPASSASIQYTVKIQPVGFFGSVTNPSDRFDNFGTIFTQ